MEKQQFDLMMGEIKGVRADFNKMETMVIAHDRDIRAVKVVGKFVGLILAGIAGVVTFYLTVLQMFSFRK